MGISEADLAFIASLGDWPRRVCDLGDQDLLCNDETAFDRLGVKAPRRGKARDFWRALGIDCMSLDVVGDVTRFDLNTDAVRPEWGQFDLVTNCGDTEHVFNQVNCFTVIHELTRVGGVMYHQLPVGGYAWHGLFVYTLKFFRLLADANRYEVMRATADLSDTTIDKVNTAAGRLEALHPVIVPRDAGLRVAFRKTSGRAFRVPLDAPPTGLRKAIASVRHGAALIKRRLLHQP